MNIAAPERRKIFAGDPADHDPAVDDDGSLRRADTRHRQVRPRRAAAKRDHTHSRPRLPGVRHAAGDDRKGDRDRRRPRAIFCSFGDMLRVPGSARTCFTSRRKGGEVHIVYSPLDALKIAERAIQTRKSFSSPLDLKPPPRATRWRSEGRNDWDQEFFDASLARARASGDRGDAFVAGQSRAGIPGRRSRVHGDGL